MILTFSDLRDTAYGAAFLGCGGGGTLSASIAMLNENLPMDARVELLTVDEAAEKGGNSAVCSFVGSQTKGKGVTGVKPVTDALERFAQYTGKEFSYLAPLELGVQSSVIPSALAAHEKGLALIDGDGAGRSVMGVMLTNYAFVGLPAKGVACNGQGTSVVIEACEYHPDPPTEFGPYSDALVFNITAGQVSLGQAFGVAGVAMWAMDPSALRKAVAARGTLDLARRVGGLCGTGDSIDAIVDLLNQRQGAGARVLFRGKIKGSDTSKLDYLTVMVEGEDGSEIKVLTAGETVVAFKGDHPIAMGPDSMCWITATGRPFTNTEIPEAGTEVAMIGATAQGFLRQEQSIRQFEYFYRTVGYRGEYQPIENLDRP